MCMTFPRPVAEAVSNQLNLACITRPYRLEDKSSHSVAIPLLTSRASTWMLHARIDNSNSSTASLSSTSKTQTSPWSQWLNLKYFMCWSLDWAKSIRQMLTIFWHTIAIISRKSSCERWPAISMACLPISIELPDWPPGYTAWFQSDTW